MAPAPVCYLSNHLLPNPGLPRKYLGPHPCALCTCANHEKQISAQHNERFAEYYPALYETAHHPKDRRVRIPSSPWAGLEGVRLRAKGRYRAINLNTQSISVEAGAADIES